MFHTLLTLAFIIPNIYVFLRVGQLFINKGNRVYYAIVYILLASLYPISNLFHEQNTSILTSVFNIVGNYMLPFYLYLFLFILVYDIFLLTNKLVMIVPDVRTRGTRFKTITLSLFVLLSIGVVIAGVVNFKTIRISEYQIEVPQKSSKLDHLKIAFAADFHLQEGSDIQFVERFVRRIEEIKPDIILFGGDMVEGDQANEDMTRIEHVLSGIKSKYGAYGVLGNHEHYAGRGKQRFFDKSGIVVLKDTIVVFDSSFSLGGRLDLHFKNRKTIDQLMQPANSQLPMILVDHRPTEMNEVCKTIADVQLSGHTHNGQLFPINFITQQKYQLSWGYKKIENTHFFVTSGIQLWGPPVRTTGKSEIMVVDVTFTKN